MKEPIIVAEIVRPHGRRGEVLVRPLTDNPETLLTALEVYLGQEVSAPVRVEGVRLHKGDPLLKLEGVDDIDSALALKGAEVCLPLDELKPLEEGEYFLHDLLGLTVLDQEGNEVGSVAGFAQTGGPPLMVIPGSENRDILIPFAEGTIDEVDLERETITLVDLPGLIEN